MFVSFQNFLYFCAMISKQELTAHKRRTTFRGLNPLAERSVLVALQRRYKVLSGS